MKITKSILKKALRETLAKSLNENNGDSYAGIEKYRKSFVEFVKLLSKKGNQKNTPPYTGKPTVGKSGPAGSP